MDNLSILSHTDQALLRLPDSRRLGLTYGLWAAGLSLALQLVSFIAGTMTENTGGLGGIGMRSALQTVQALCAYVSMIVLPFLQYGHQAVGLNTAKGCPSEKTTLLWGFRRFGPFLRLALLWLLLFLAVTMAASNAAGILYMLLPGTADTFLEVQELMMNDPNSLMGVETAEALLLKMWPMYVIFGALMIALLIPLAYRLRLVSTAILDGENKVIHSMFASWKNMRTHCKQLFFLDLRFWPYFLLTGFATVVAYGDQLLGLSGDVAYWSAILLSLAIQVLAAAVYLPRFHTAQAKFYLSYYPTEQPSQKESL